MMKLTKNDYYPLATVRKLREAELFLKQAKEYMASDPFFSEAIFNAFIQSVWSVTQYLKKELTDFDNNEISKGALDWYNEAIKKIKGNRTCRLFWELRTECAHRQMIEPKPIIAVSLSACKTDIKIEGFFISYFEGKMKKFKDYHSKNLIDLAEDHMCIIRSIVEEAVKKFGFKERPLKNFHTRPGYIKIEAKARAMNYMTQKIILKQNKRKK